MRLSTSKVLSVADNPIPIGYIGTESGTDRDWPSQTRRKILLVPVVTAGQDLTMPNVARALSEPKVG
jgi:hypothetical protein